MPKGNLTYASGFVKNISITAIDITKKDLSFNDLLDIIKILLEYILSQKPSKFKNKMIFSVVLISERIGNPVIGDASLSSYLFLSKPCQWSTGNSYAIAPGIP
ncbi:MAG: hypothetical protein QG642_185 [Patescibacteria group bacterium]|nr:hypothetical protein [Patescibacteria group bacterium]